MPLTKDGIYFKDTDGRVRILHGVNLSGATKVPVDPNGATHIQDGFFNHRDVCFVGRPFPLADADEHFRRLKHWGFDFIRFLVTWEAIEHAGPGQYDENYLQYLEAVIDKAAAYDIDLFIDFHQDVWSRFSGGDGAPGWTLEKVGFEMRNFKATGAAIVHQTHGDPFPRMIWASNYTKLASATMFTLFFAGNDFAPETKIDGQPVQEYFQSIYCNMLKTVASRFRDKVNVIGYDLINEPSRGYIGLRDLRKIEWLLKTGDMPTPYQTMLLGSGFAQEVQRWHLGWMGMHRRGTTLIDPKGMTAWQDGAEPVWKKNGVWDIDSRGNPVLLRPDYFYAIDGEHKTFAQDYMRPFINRAADALHEADDNAMSFVEFDAMGREEIPVWEEDISEKNKTVYAPHWYPFILLMSKRYVSWVGLDSVRSIPVFGNAQKRRSFARNLRLHKDIAQASFHGVPTVIGEIGIPYDLNNRQGYRRNNWNTHLQAIDEYMDALEANMLSFTLWNYTPDNTNARGDLWNGEDLSIFSYDQQDRPSDINSGGRALIAVVRPHARAIAGTPLSTAFDMEAGIYTFSFRHDDRVNAPTEVYVPTLQYPDGLTVHVSDGQYDYLPDEQLVIYRHSGQDMVHTVTIKPKGDREIYDNTETRNWLLSLSAASLAIIAAILFFWGNDGDGEAEADE